MMKDMESRNNFCMQCGWCCRGHGNALMNREDISRISSYLKMSEYDFVLNYCFKKQYGLYLKVKNSVYYNGDCIFLNARTNLCEIHDVKPERCRSWPHWPELKTDPGFQSLAFQNCAAFRLTYSRG